MNDEIRDEIKARLDCRRYLKKSKRGNYICPYCHSGEGTHQTGALAYYEDTNTFYCHACGRNGDVLDLLQEVYALDYVKALEMGAEELGTPAKIDGIRQYNGVSDTYSQKTKKDAENGQESATEAPADYTSYYEKCRARLNDPDAVSYLKARGISLKTAEACGVGYDPAADPAGAPGAAAGDHKPHPTRRLIFPTSKAQYMGRSIDPTTPASYGKINAKGGSVGIFNADVLHAADVVFITEGVFDAMSLQECGAAAVALNSANNGNKLITLLKDAPSTARFCIVFDADPNPETAARTNKKALELADELQTRGHRAFVYNLAEIVRHSEKDVNDVLRSDPARVKAIIDAARKELGMDELQRFFNAVQSEQYKPYSTGIAFFDDLLSGGPIRQTLTLLLAAPGTGKTTLCQQIAEAMAAQHKPVIYLNLEMSREQMLAKTISGRISRGKTGIKISALEVLQGYNWTPAQREAVQEEISLYRREIYPYLRYNPGNVGSDLDAIKDYLRSVGDQLTEAGREAPAVILDYLHLVSCRRTIETAELLKQVVIMLKQYAIRYNTIVIGIVATNRASNAGGKITIDSGRDTSNLEYTADYQLALNYYAIDNGTIKTDDAEGIAALQAEPWRQMIVRVLKSRFSMPGRSANVYFNPRENRFLTETGFIPDGARPFPKQTAPRIKK